MSQTLTIEYPDLLPDSLSMSRSEFEREARLAMAAKLFEMEKFTSGQAVRLAGLERVDFLLDQRSIVCDPQREVIEQWIPVPWKPTGCLSGGCWRSSVLTGHRMVMSRLRQSLIWYTIITS